MTALAGFWRNKTPAPPPANAAPPPLRVAHGISALGIMAIFLAMHLANRLTFILGPDTYRAVMKVTRNVYRQGFLQPLLIALFLFQVGRACASLRTPTSYRWTVSTPSRSLVAFSWRRTCSDTLCVRVCAARSRHRSDWAFATGAPSGLVKDAWNIRLVPHHGLGVFFVLSHLAAGARGLMLSYSVDRRHAERFLIGGATAAGLVASVILFGMCGARLNFAIP